MSERDLFSETKEMNQGDLTNLTLNCKLLKEYKQEVEKCEENLKEAKKKVEIMSRETIPAILNNAGIEKIKLSSGEEVIIEDKLKASITNKNYVLAYSSMIKAEGGDDNAEEIVDDLFNSKLVLENFTQKTIDILLDNDLPYHSDRKIHPQTLKKYCKEKLEKGEKIPEGISVFQYQETKIK